MKRGIARDARLLNGGCRSRRSWRVRGGGASGGVIVRVRKLPKVRLGSELLRKVERSVWPARSGLGASGWGPVSPTGFSLIVAYPQF